MSKSCNTCCNFYKPNYCKLEVTDICMGNNSFKYYKARKKCKHYNAPVHNETCKIGINYLVIAGGERKGYMAKLPCFQIGLTKDMVNCDKFEEYTKEELEAQEKERKERWQFTMQAISEIKKSEKQHGQIECPKCKGKLGFIVSGYNGHIWCKCETENCLCWMQ